MTNNILQVSKPGRSRQQTKRLKHTLTLIGIGCFFTLFVTLVQPLSSTNLWLSDQLFASEPPSSNIVVVGIDDDTLNTYGRWSEWPRSLHTQAIDNLREAKAKVIGMDIVFADSSPDDETLATAMENAGNVVLAAVGTKISNLSESELIYDDFLLPVSLLEQSSIGIGHANITPDPDGTVRRLPLIVKDSIGQIYPAFSLTILYNHFSMQIPQEYPLDDGMLNLLARDIPVDDFYQMRINFSSEDTGRTYLSYGDVISGNFDPSLVENKIVLIGMTATGELDTWGIPTSTSKVPGVFIHAVTMDTILMQRFLTEVGISVTVITLLILVGITAFLLPRLNLRWGGVLVGGLFGCYLIASFQAFDGGYILNMLYLLALLPTIYIGSITYMILIEQSDKRFIKDLFGRYVSPQVSREILNLADTNELKLGGEERQVTVLFADIRQYTKISEQMSPEAIVDMLNTYLSIIIDRVLQNDGMVNKFAGDNIMGVWNAPQTCPEHAWLSVKAALESQRLILEKQQNDPSLPHVQFGIGINTGEALAGNVGSMGRAEYTVIGDAVNLASRICSVTPGGEVWIGPETYHQTVDYLEVEEMEPQEFKGKTERIVVYRVIGRHSKDEI